MKKINKHEIALKRKEILDKAEKLKAKGIKYKEMEEIDEDKIGKALMQDKVIQIASIDNF